MANKSYSRLWDGYATDADAKAARDKEYRRLKKIPGANPHRWVLKNQLKQYDGFGIPNGGSCDVFEIEYNIWY